MTSVFLIVRVFKHFMQLHMTLKLTRLHILFLNFISLFIAKRLQTPLETVINSAVAFI